MLLRVGFTSAISACVHSAGKNYWLYNMGRCLHFHMIAPYINVRFPCNNAGKMESTRRVSMVINLAEEIFTWPAAWLCSRTADCVNWWNRNKRARNVAVSLSYFPISYET